MKPLEGIRVLDFTQYLSGPMCTLIMGDLGAEIIKLERYPDGDNTRTAQLVVGPTTTYFVSANRGKKSVLMDVSDPNQREVFYKMVKDADVVVENFKPGTMEKNHCGYEDLKKINPRIIYTAISGFGQTGPWSSRPALDLVIQAASGLMSITGEKGGEPQKCGVSISDITAGLFACIGTIAAIHARTASGEGQYLDISMLESSFAIMEAALTRYKASGKIPGPIGNRHAAGAPFQPYWTKDGDRVFICAPTNPQFKVLADALGHPEWMTDPLLDTTPHRLDNIEYLEETINSVTKQYSSKDLCELLESKKVVNGQINNIAQIAEHPQIIARNAIMEVTYDGAPITFQCPASPIRMSGMEHQTKAESPVLGAATLEVLKDYVDEKTLKEFYAPLVEQSAHRFDNR